MKGLKVDNLQVSFRGRQVVKGISFEIPPGARVGLIGESGSGKSVTALALMGLLGEGAKISGSVSLEGQELLSLTDRQMARLRGAKIGMIFQEPMTALDPTMRVGKQVAEVLALHQGGRRGKRQEVIKMLERVGLPAPEQSASAFPHQLSGGQRQRVMMAMALINAPQLLICDEPTTALDVTVQAKVLRLLDKELTASASACLFISHDLAVVNQICDYLLVMYQGQIVERGPLQQVLAQPKHPYTRGLLATADIAAVKPGARRPLLSAFFRGRDECATGFPRQRFNENLSAFGRTGARGSGSKPGSRCRGTPGNRRRIRFRKINLDPDAMCTFSPYQRRNQVCGADDYRAKRKTVRTPTFPGTNCVSRPAQLPGSANAGGQNYYRTVAFPLGARA